MTENLRQRRGTKSAEASTSSSLDADTGQPTPLQQLRNAQAKLIISRDRTADLHTAWRNQLFRLSLVVVCVSIHQLQSSISSCILEVKGSNKASGGEGSEGYLSGAESIKLIFVDSFCELLGVFISSLLAYFLALSRTDALELDNWPYMVSSAIVPVSLGFYFHSTNKLGCLRGDNALDNFSDSAQDQRHQFPAVVIYHTIVTVAFWFMKNGMHQCEGHVNLVEGSIKDFERMEKKLELKKQLKMKKRAKK
ncbi:hypothetical protein ACHAWF_007281 [Thalassiosira exigua]